MTGYEGLCQEFIDEIYGNGSKYSHISYIYDDHVEGARRFAEWLNNHSSKAKEVVSVPDIKILKMLKALDNPIRLEIVNFILSKQGEKR